MFPRPIEKSSAPARVGYQAFLPVALFIWLVPLLAIFMTSIRGAADINSGNVFGWPSEFNMIENYVAVFTQSEAATYMLNSVLITVPTVIISVALACLPPFLPSHFLRNMLVNLQKEVWPFLIFLVFDKSLRFRTMQVQSLRPLIP